MPRRPAQEEDDVSLFPFLSIIAAIIGVLTLMIAAVTLGQMNQDDVKDAIKNAIAMDELQKELAGIETAVSELSVQLDSKQAEMLKNAGQRQNELVKTRAELESLLKQLETAKKQTAQKQKIKIVIPEVPQTERETAADLQKQYSELQEKLAILRKALDNKKKPPKEAQVSVTPGGSGLSFTPNFVECRAGAIVLHTFDPPSFLDLNSNLIVFTENISYYFISCY